MKKNLQIRDIERKTLINYPDIIIISFFLYEPRELHTETIFDLLLIKEFNSDYSIITNIISLNKPGNFRTFLVVSLIISIITIILILIDNLQINTKTNNEPPVKYHDFNFLKYVFEFYKDNVKPLGIFFIISKFL